MLRGGERYADLPSFVKLHEREINMEHVDVVRLLWEEMGKKHEFTWCKKDKDNWFSNLAGSVLEALNVQPKETFMKQYVTTIVVPGSRTIHVPFEPGVAGDWSLESQEDVLAHECTHIVDAQLMGVVGYDFRYLASPAQRAHFETRARQSDLEYSRFRFGQRASAEQLAKQLEFYACAKEVPYVQKSLDSMLLTVDAGGIVTQSVKDMLEILRREAPEFISFDPMAPR